MCNLCYNAVVLTKIVKIALLGPYLKSKKKGQHGPHPKPSSTFLKKITKRDHKLSRTFISSKYYKF